MASVGSDPGALRDTALQFRRRASEIRDSASQVDRVLENTQWSGSDAERFRADWSQKKQDMLRVADSLDSKAADLYKQAEEQEAASGAKGSGLFGFAAGGIAAAMAAAKTLGFSVPGETGGGSAGGPGAQPSNSAQSSPENPKAASGVGAFRHSYLGKKVDYDGAYGYQCVDLANRYAHDLFGVHAHKSLGGGNAADIFGNASSAYFEKVGAGSRPQPGDIVCIGAYRGNPYGHIAIVSEVHADGTYSVIEQNGFTQTPASEGKIASGQLGAVQGYLRPKSDKIK